MKRPWNIPSLAVYSLATYSGGKLNMNICTYVSAVSMHPKRYIIGVYKGTKSLENIKKSKQAVLQLLQPEQYPLVRVLGKKSGNQFDKQLWLEKRGILTNWKGFQVLSEASAYLLLEKVNEIPGGDHQLYLMEVKAWKVNQENYLSTKILGDKNIIRI